MLESFGSRLRQRREEQAIALLTIAEETKIKRALLEGLERDDVSQWPSGIFRRAFIRAYAHAIGLSPDAVVREFLEIHPDPVEDVATIAAVAAALDGAGTKEGPPTRFRNMVGSAIGSLSRVRVPSPAPPESASSLSARQPALPDIDLLAVADLCTEFGRVEHAQDVQPLLQKAAGILDAVGLVVWVWDSVASGLRPVLAHGYSDKVLAQLPTLRRDADNATAAAFRSGQVCVIKGRPDASGALVVPLLTPAGCAGVFAIELQHGAEQTPLVAAVVTIFAAQLAQLVNGAASGSARPAQADFGSGSVAR